MQHKNSDLEFFQAWWKIFRKYQNPPKIEITTDEANAFWKAMCTETRSLAKMYENDSNYPFYSKMCLSLIDEVGRRAGKVIDYGKKR